jgi:DNA-binding transcriptional MerR regulator
MNGWLLAELAQLTGLAETTVRYYMHRRIIQPIQVRGTATRYDRRSLERLLGVMRLKIEEQETTLADKQRKLDAMDDAELEQWVRAGSLPPAAAAALGFEPAPVVDLAGTITDAKPHDETSMESPPALGIVEGEQWQRVALLPGLELMVRADAKGLARIAAQRICQEYRL